MSWIRRFIFFFFFNDTATTEIYTLSLHDALPICAVADEVGRHVQLHPPALERRHQRLDLVRLAHQRVPQQKAHGREVPVPGGTLEAEMPLGGEVPRSEEHTSELQSPCNLVCSPLLEQNVDK